MSRRIGCKGRTSEEIRKAVLAAIGYDRVIGVSTIGQRARLSQPHTERIIEELRKDGLVRIASKLELNFKDQRISTWYALTHSGMLLMSEMMVIPNA